ncbi:MAG: hypothetical protein ACREJR_10360 [Candidatus Rokuibacteriota bacterium]
MSGVAVVWLVVGLVSTAAVLAVLIGLVRHVLVLLRSLGRFQREITPVAQAISAEGERAAARSRRVAARRSSARPAG